MVVSDNTLAGLSKVNEDISLGEFIISKSRRCASLGHSLFSQYILRSRDNSMRYYRCGNCGSGYFEESPKRNFFEDKTIEKILHNTLIPYRSL